ncbi:MAG: hypothetical protein ABL307_16610 [Roseitalea porphyridii]|uniref:restriction endonuclease subunit S n=1 Tax=Roseitalea porphyridii TaxID=1852022 RepID=UPI0032D993BE
MNEDHFFKVSWGMLQDRFDPLPFQPSFFLRRLLDHGRHEYVRFSSIAGGFGNGFPLGREQQADATTSVVQLRPTNMDAEGRWLFEKVTFVEDSAVPPSAKEITAGEVVFNNTNSQQLIGKSAVWDASFGERAVLSNHMTQIVMNDGFDPEIYAYILNIYRRNRVFYNLATNWNNQSGFAGDRLRALPLPKLSPSDQLQLAKRIGDSKEQSRKRLAEADALLASIDDYLLAELGVTLPPEPDNTIDKRMFRTKSSDLGGWRFDARVHQYDFNLHSATYANAKLGTICAINPKTVFRGLTGTDDVSFVPMDAISDRLGIIEKPDTRVLAENVGYTSFREGDLLWAKITPCMENGKSAVAEGLHRGVGYGSTEYHVLRSPDGSLDMGYLHALLRMKRVRKAAVRFFTGASGHQRVDADFLRTLELPVPSLDVQKALAAEARTRVARAVQLEEEANAELERAKADIEAILLGDAA